ncbi:EFR1 family ferrodoxin [Caproicibacter sp.]|uniref:EFR1 family ferrodoxin n=1 Tax=Caproicibacter sp. TaxID=2814884 RepID=UPI0039898595
MKILIAYFSGTGNTRYCAEYLKKRLEQPGNHVDLRSVERLPAKEAENYDFLVAGFPVYACDAPEIIKRFFAAAALTARKGAYLFCTKGFYSGNALKNAADLLRDSGYKILGWADVGMPGSDGLAFLKPDSRAAKKMYDRDFSRIEPLDRLSEVILADAGKTGDGGLQGKRIPKKITGAAANGLFRLAYAPLEKWMTAKFHADQNCVRCGFCEKICPAGNIRVTKEGVHFDGSCFLCMRCVHQCPKAAIQIGTGTVGKMRWKGPDGRFHPLERED